MLTYKYLIIGGGMTADAAVKAIRKIDKDGTIGLISSEAHPPYKRPPLSKKLWDKPNEDSVWLKTDQYVNDLYLETYVETLDPQKNQVRDSKGNIYSYERLLLATGGSPRQFEFGKEDILYFRYLDDFRKLKSSGKQNFVVIGGGFIGSELAAALNKQGKQVSLIFPEKGIGADIFPTDLAEFLNLYYEEKGVKVFPEEWVKDVKKKNEEIEVSSSTKSLPADQVTAGIGVVANSQLAEKAGLKVQNGGILVDEHLRTSETNIFAAGDAAVIYNTVLEQYMHYEHEDNAVKMGDAAGKNMAGQENSYAEYLPYFYSDLFDLGYEAVGLLSKDAEKIANWQEPYKKGIVYYRQKGRIKGVLLWNTWGKIGDARRVIRESRGKNYSEKELKELISFE